MRKIVGAVLALALSASLALGQGAGQLPSGYFVGNSGASAGQAAPASLTAMFNRALCGTQNNIPIRGASLWACGTLSSLLVQGTGINLSGTGVVTITLANPSATTIGGVQSYASVSHQWINAISTLGAPSSSQPAIADISGWGTGVATALGVNIGTAGAPLVNGGALGTPSGGNAANLSGLPIAGIASLGTNVATALGTATGSPNGLPLVIATGTIALGTSGITAGACGTAATASATGMATTDVIDVGFNGDPTATTGYTPGAMLTLVVYPTANTVNVKQCNLTTGTVTPSALTLNWKVRR